MRTKIGILGGGQLARMTIEAGHPLGIQFSTFDSKSACAGNIAQQVVGKYDNKAALNSFAEGCEVISYEFENVDAGALEHFENNGKNIFPSPGVLQIFQDRINEKGFFTKLLIPTAYPYYVIMNDVDIEMVETKMLKPMILKTVRFGYDGKGQRVVRDKKNIRQAWEELGKAPCILEPFIHFDAEVSIAIARNEQNEIVTYPVTRNFHYEGKLRLSLASAHQVHPKIKQQAEEYGRILVQELAYVGVLVVEFLQSGYQLFANEAAPRPHNSYHWSIEGAQTSQFENFVRALSGLPLGPTDINGFWAMINLIDELPELADIYERVPDAKPHFYGKEIRPTKLGHITIRGETRSQLLDKIARVKDLPGVWLPEKY